MSLTRQEWEAMWKDIKTLEDIAKKIKPSQGVWALMAINRIKKQIQSVIGQME